jgi:hypothetical protein
VVSNLTLIVYKYLQSSKADYQELALMTTAAENRPNREVAPAPCAMTASLPAFPTLARTAVGPPLNGVYEVNERCLEMLVCAARHEDGRGHALVAELRELLKASNRTVRERAARVNFVLVDMEFADIDFWHTVCSHPGQQLKTPAWRGSFPRGSATPLAHATLMLAWNSLRTDPIAARVLFGMARPVAQLIMALRFDEIDRIARKRFRHVRPRWDDRPAMWRRLLLAAQSDDPKPLSALTLHAVQLLTGELLEDRDRSAPARAVPRTAARKSGRLDQAPR